MSAKGNEAFYMENGVKKDAAIHDFILDGVDPEHELQQRIESFRATVALGVDPVLAAQAYGLPEGFDIGPGPESLR